jgi:hypothetical protein
MLPFPGLPSSTVSPVTFYTQFFCTTPTTVPALQMLFAILTQNCELLKDGDYVLINKLYSTDLSGGH